ncbi:MAG: hypothetical protein AB7E81_20140 [Hyphomicrobiaceae bacterium]
MSKFVSAYDSTIPMLSDVPALIQNNPLWPAGERNSQAAFVRKVIRWFETCAKNSARVDGPSPPSPAAIPFTRLNLKIAFAQLTIAHLDVVNKTIANALSSLNGIADRLGMPRGYAFAPLSSECQALHELLVTREDRGSCIRLFRVMSAHGIAPQRVADAVPMLREQIEGDWRIKRKDREFKRALYAWNTAAKSVPGWPQVLLDVPRVRKVWGLRWRDHLSDLEKSVDRLLAAGDPNPTGEDLFAGPAARPLRKSTKEGRKEAARMVASALRDANVDVNALRHVRDICRPERFKIAFRVLSARAGGVTRTIMRYASDIRKLAKLPDILTSDELAELAVAYQKLRVHHEKFLGTVSRDRGQELLDRLDDPTAMDAYLALAHREAQEALRSRRPFSVGNAYKIARALTLEIWHTVPWRIGVAAAWRLDQFVEVELEGEKRIMVRAPKDQPANKRTPDQFLSPEAGELLRIFLKSYRPIILHHNKATASPYLFPGRLGRQRHPHTMRQQMNGWIRKHTGLDFHPHAVRKISPKLILDADPTAIGLAIRSGGWADDRMLRKIYGQKNHRQSQMKINEFVQGRRLRAISTLRVPAKRGTKKQPRGAN